MQNLLKTFQEKKSIFQGFCIRKRVKMGIEKSVAAMASKQAV
jgi:hypothetical protein